jgi:hypothetical protein
MSYSCKDFGPNQVCDGCGRHPQGSSNVPRDTSGTSTNHPPDKPHDGMNRAQRRAAIKAARKVKP